MFEYKKQEAPSPVSNDELEQRYKSGFVLGKNFTRLGLIGTLRGLIDTIWERTADHSTYFIPAITVQFVAGIIAGIEEQGKEKETKRLKKKAKKK